MQSVNNLILGFSSRLISGLRLGPALGSMHSTESAWVFSPSPSAPPTSLFLSLTFSFSKINES